MREAEFFFTEGEKHYILEDYTKALLYYQRTAELNPTNPTVHYKIADVFSRNQNEEDLIKASGSIETAIRLDPNNKYFYLLASNIFANLNQYTKAQEILEK
ncbi:MAG: tetratricopeptide repeat protein [Flammeovirgaceae bacterium]|nr:tetratricopeptide repeat protein [Flammeovirgaceae bacterium]